MPHDLFLAFSADWREPPGKVIAVFRDRESAEHFCYEEKFGFGYSVVHVEVPDA